MLPSKESPLNSSAGAHLRGQDGGLPQGCAGTDSRSNCSLGRNAAGGPRQPQGGLQLRAAPVGHRQAHLAKALV